MNAVIIEDEPLAADRLEKLLVEVAPGMNVLARLDSVNDSIRWLQNYKPDLIFLDIQLSDGLSFAIFEEVTVNTPVIFTTAYDQYAIKAFELNSIAYLMKPIRKAELRDSLDKLNSLRAAYSIDFDRLLAEIRGDKPEHKKRFLVQIGERFHRIQTSDVAYFYAFEKAVYLRTFQGKSYPIDYSLDQLENQLDPRYFFRINRQLLINIEAIDEMTAWSRSRIKLELKALNDRELNTVVSIDRSGEFKKWLG